MNLGNLDILNKHNFKFNKAYGQNFIFDTNLLRSIVDKVDVTGKTVLEIGPGAGTLTAIIAEKASRVVAYEIDRNLQPILEENLSRFNNVEVVFGDIMKFDMSDIEDKLGNDYIMVANLPYYITTPIIFKFLENATRLQSMSIMVQKEVADRLVAKPNTKDYGAITASIDYRANASIIKNVNRNMFTPAPNVDSAIVKIDFDTSKYDIINTKILDDTIKSVFAMRRKTIENNLKSSFKISSELVNQIVSEAGLRSGLRGETLSTQELVTLANTIARILIK
ncbi:MAG: ribosomal RNA small subunit methyltransferase A [Clostridiales bacterium]|nr:ribosomal RNA small subunit methyltransferase A [Clostridiales bacterium]